MYNRTILNIWTENWDKYIHLICKYEDIHLCVTD